LISLDLSFNVSETCSKLGNLVFLVFKSIDWVLNLEGLALLCDFGLEDSHRYKQLLNLLLFNQTAGLLLIFQALLLGFDDLDSLLEGMLCAALIKKAFKRGLELRHHAFLLALEACLF